MKKETVEFLREEALSTDTYNGEIVGFGFLEEQDEDEFSKKDLLTLIAYLDEELKELGQEYKPAIKRILRNLERESE